MFTKNIYIARLERGTLKAHVLLRLPIPRVCLHSQTSVPLGVDSGGGALRSAPFTDVTSGADTGALPSALWTDDVPPAFL